MCIGLYNIPVHNVFYDLSPIAQEEWLELMDIAKKHGVKYLFFESISKLPAELQPPAALHMQWYVETVKAEERFSNYKNNIEQLAALFAQNGLPMMLIKGYSIAQLYPVPARREGGDIDIFLFGKQQQGELIIAELYGNGHLKTKGMRSKHSQFFFNGIGVDNHINFVKDTSGLTPKLEIFYGRIESIIQNAISEKNIETIKIGEQTIYALNPNTAALYLTTHLFRHISINATAIRHFCDWVVFFNYYRNSFDRELLLQQIEECGLSKFVANVEAFCQERLMFEPYFAFGNKYEIVTGKRLIEHVVLNFSQKLIGNKTISIVKKSLSKMLSSQRCYAEYLGLTNYFDYFIPNVLARIKQLVTLKF